MRHELVTRRVYLQRVNAFAHHLARHAPELVRAVTHHGERVAMHVPEAYVTESAGHGQLG